MALGDLFGTGRERRLEALPLTPAEEAEATFRKATLPAIQQQLVPRAADIGRAQIAGIAQQPQDLRDLAASFFPTTQPTTPQAAIEATLPGLAGPLQRQYEQQALPALQAAFQAMGAGRSGQGVTEAENLFRRQVSDPLSEALARTAVQQAQFNQTQELQRRQAQVGLLTPQDQALANLAQGTLAMKAPQQTIIPFPAEQPGLGTQALLGGALTGTGIGGAVSKALMSGAGDFLSELTGTPAGTAARQAAGGSASKAGGAAAVAAAGAKAAATAGAKRVGGQLGALGKEWVIDPITKGVKAVFAPDSPDSSTVAKAYEIDERSIPDLTGLEYTEQGYGPETVPYEYPTFPTTPQDYEIDYWSAPKYTPDERLRIAEGSELAYDPEENAFQ